MADDLQQPKKKVKRMATKNVRVTETTHLLVTTLADILDVPVSDAIEKIIREEHPEVVKAAERRAKEREDLKPIINKSQN